MFGKALHIWGHDLAVGNYQFENAWCVEYHVDTFNNIETTNGELRVSWKIVGMETMREGVTLNQLILIYLEYKIGFHVVDLKYHLTASHNDHGYKPTQHMPN